MFETTANDRFIRYINIEEGLGRVRGNKSLYKRMLSMFMEADELGVLETSLLEKNYNEAAKSAHAIKGIAGNLSLTMLFEISNELVRELRNGELNEKTVSEFQTTLERTRSAVKDTIIKIDIEGF